MRRALRGERDVAFETRVGPAFFGGDVDGVVTLAFLRFAWLRCTEFVIVIALRVREGDERVGGVSAGRERVSIQVRMLPREDVADPNLARDALCVRARAFLASPTWIDRRRRKERRASPRREVRHKNFNCVVLGGREAG